MRIVLASSEAVPFSKTGGLADVSSALSKALAHAGHDVWLIVPYYPRLPKQLQATDLGITPTGQSVEVTIAAKQLKGTLRQAKLPGSDVKVLLVDRPDYYDREGLYQHEGQDYKDNCERFVFFCRAAMEAIRSFDIRPDIIHAHDWQAALMPALLQIEYQQQPGFTQAASVFTIHNLAFQGRFWHWDMLLTGIDWKYFNWRQMEFFEHLNLLKTGMVFSEMVTTVSPTYAQEIQTPEFGCGLDVALAARSQDLVGILNGVDKHEWNPEIDEHLACRYSVDTVSEGKAACKTHLQKAVGLPQRSDVPLIGMISRLTDQKGLDLIAECVDEILTRDVQFCFLGSGEAKYEEMLQELTRRHPEKVKTIIAFDEKRAHEIEAGADLFLMPSQFEPCGLNQMYSLIYGTVPIVRAVGGLADSVVDATEENIANGTATGFSFDNYRSDELAHTMTRALEMYNDKQKWAELMNTGMRQDWSWSRSAAEYVTVYQNALKKCETTTVG